MPHADMPYSLDAKIISRCPRELRTVRTWHCKPQSRERQQEKIAVARAGAMSLLIGDAAFCHLLAVEHGLLATDGQRHRATAATTRTREAQMSKFGAGERVRSDNSPVSGIGTVIAWDDPRCLFAADDWKAHTAVAWDDETVTIVADEALSSAADVDWDKEARGPED